MPSRQNLLGLWMLLCGVLLFGGIGLLLWLDTLLTPATPERVALWVLGLSPAVVVLMLGMVLERRLFRPLRQFQVLLARLVASPDARSDFPLDGWLKPLQPDLDHIRDGWRGDRARLRDARDEGAAEALRIQQELEGVLQVLDLPLLICDDHQRLLLFNPAARELFHDQPALGLGRRISQLLPHASLNDALKQLPQDGSPRQLLLPGEPRWLRCELRRLGARHGGALITLRDTTHELESDQRWRRELAALLPRLRGHAGSLGSAADALVQVEHNPELQHRLEQAISQESQALSQKVEALTRLVESHQLSQSGLEETWSNDLFSALGERLHEEAIELTPVGIPVWIRVDGPALLAMLERLIRELVQIRPVEALDIEVLLGNKRVYLDLIWQGEPLTDHQLSLWHALHLFDDPLSPRIQDVLEQHGAELWSQPRNETDTACLRLPLPASSRGARPQPRTEQPIDQPRPEFHDFSIADLPAPDAALAHTRLEALELVVFDTETTGLDLRGGDQIISLAACRILRGRLLAQDSFDQLINPQRPIPPESTAIHHLTDADVANAPPIEVVLPRFHQYVGPGVLVAHNAVFDLLALRLASGETGPAFDMPVLDTLLLSRAIDPTLEGHGLDALAERFELTFPPGTRHTALGDARATAELLLALLPRLRSRGIETLEQLLELQREVEQGRPS
jgi:DNA polymerase-3 subunit epsilon